MKYLFHFFKTAWHLHKHPSNVNYFIFCKSTSYFPSSITFNNSGLLLTNDNYSLYNWHSGASPVNPHVGLFGGGPTLFGQSIGVSFFQIKHAICSQKITNNLLIEKKTISTSILQTFRSWVATSHLRPPMAFISHNSSDTPGVLLLWMFHSEGCDFPISFSVRDMSRNVWNRL